MSDNLSLCKSVFQNGTQRISNQTFTQAFLTLVYQMERISSLLQDCPE